MKPHVPWTIWAFIAAMVSTLVLAALPGGPSMGDPELAVALTLLWSVLLVRRSRTAWRLLVGLYGLAAIALVGLAGFPWSAALTVLLALVVASLGALLARPTRRWVGQTP